MNDHQEQLTSFEQQIVEHPQLASSYATNGFLEALICLNGEALDGDNIILLKNVIRAFTIVLPPVFLTITKPRHKCGQTPNKCFKLFKALGSIMLILVSDSMLSNVFSS
ncbi:unnamed protein product [Absidia cylindrospora]